MRLILLAAAVLLSGCATSWLEYAEPILFSCGYLPGDSSQDFCHTSVYRVPVDERTEALVESMRRANDLEAD